MSDIIPDLEISIKECLRALTNNIGEDNVANVVGCFERNIKTYEDQGYDVSDYWVKLGCLEREIDNMRKQRDYFVKG